MTKPTKTKSNSDMTTITRAAPNRVIFAALLSVLASALLLGGCSPCIDEVIWRKPSPDSKLTVTVFLRDCGATTKPVSWVTVHPSSGRYDNEKDIALTADRVQKIDRKSTRLNSSHGYISYAVFCLKKKNLDLHDA